MSSAPGIPTLRDDLRQFAELVALQERAVLCLYQDDHATAELRGRDGEARDVLQAEDAFRAALGDVMLFPNAEWQWLRARAADDGLNATMTLALDRLQRDEWRHLRRHVAPEVIAKAVEAGARWHALARLPPPALSLPALETAYAEARARAVAATAAQCEHPLYKTLTADLPKPRMDPLPISLIGHAEQLCERLEEAPVALRREALTDVPNAIVGRLYEARQVGYALDDGIGR